VPELGFRASNGPTQLDAVGFCIGDMGQRGGASSRIQQNQALGAQPRSNGTGEEASGLSRDAKLSAVSFLALDGSHELKCDSVRVFEVQVVTEWAFLDAGVSHAFVIELALPILEFFPCRDVKGEVIEADAVVDENVSTPRTSVLTQPHQLVAGEGEDRDVTDAIVALEYHLASE
jgi:hypothetical protein